MYLYMAFLYYYAVQVTLSCANIVLHCVFIYKFYVSMRFNQVAERNAYNAKENFKIMWQG